MEELPELKIISDCFKSLKEKGIIRTNKLVGDLGEYYCRKLFDIILNESIVEKGFDGFDLKGDKIEIKTRRLPVNSAKVSFKGFDFNYCIYLELDELYKPILALKISQEEIVKNLFADKKSLSVSRIKNKTINRNLLTDTPTFL